MNCLVDTRILLWWFEDPYKLSKKSRKIIENVENMVLISSAAIWEIVLKKKLGKLKAPDNLSALIKKEGFEQLNITHAHALMLAALKDYHSDPFDRIQIAQAMCENLSFITRDQAIFQYSIKVIKG